MANVTIVCGNSGTGKSSSLRNLNPEETIVFNVLRKRLPFKGSSKLYNVEKKNLFEIDNYQQMIQYLQAINERCETCKNIIIDDAIYVMRKEFFDRAKEKGYEVYKDLGVHFQSIIKTCENLRQDINVFLLMHIEPVMNGSTIETYKLSTVGKLLDEKYNPFEVVPMVLFSAIKFEDNKAKYGFYTHATMHNGAIVPAKSPDGMFEEDFIDNDLQVVINAMQEYY